jgi:hypothetical protein
MRESYEAELSKLRLMKQRGELVEIDRIVKAATDAGAILRASMDRIPGLALGLAAMSDHAQIRARLHASVNDAMTDFTENLSRMIETITDDSDRNK